MIESARWLAQLESERGPCVGVRTFRTPALTMGLRPELEHQTADPRLPTQGRHDHRPPALPEHHRLRTQRKTTLKPRIPHSPKEPSRGYSIPASLLPRLDTNYVLATWVGDRAREKRDAVKIGRDVWVGASAVILSGVEIGEGALVAAGSVVTSDVLPYTIVAGNPAVQVGIRFDDIDAVAHSRALDLLLDGL
jgi:Hexapeptide repeat of succinyl-transferase